MGTRDKKKFRSVSSKAASFNVVVLMVAMEATLCWDLLHHNFDVKRGIFMVVVAGLAGILMSWFNVFKIAQPLKQLEVQIADLAAGVRTRIELEPSGDELELIANAVNQLGAPVSGAHKASALAAAAPPTQQVQELKASVEAAIAASQAKSEFVANMSHELRTPLNGLLGMLDMTLDGPLEAEQKDQVETARRCGQSLLTILNDILDLSKIEAGKMALEKVPFNLRTVAEECVKSYAGQAEQKGIRLQFAADEAELVNVQGDPTRVRQILGNLVSNAVKFTERGAVRVQLATAHLSTGKLAATLRVSDTGPGIPLEKLPAIFEKFSQAEPSVTRRFGGTGLGLAIARRLVELHGGEIQVESEVGKGSVFSVMISFTQAEAPVVEVPVPGPAATPYRAPATERLLLVEDNLVNQKVFLAILRKKGYNIDIANDGREAIAKLESALTPYDLVLMDVQMPIMDGLEATRLIRGNPRWSGLPIIAMTAHAMNGDRERCLEAGMTAYLSKPVQPAQLSAAVERHLGPVGGPAESAASKPFVNFQTVELHTI